MIENKPAPLDIQICFRAVLRPEFFRNQPRMRRKLRPQERVRSIERSFQDLVEKLLHRFPEELVLTVATDIHLEGANRSPADALVSRFQILRPMENLTKHDWRKLKRACRIALFELGPGASADHVHTRIQCRGSHDFQGLESPVSAIVQALSAIRHDDRESSVRP